MTNPLIDPAAASAAVDSFTTEMEESDSLLLLLTDSRYELRQPIILDDMPPGLSEEEAYDALRRVAALVDSLGFTALVVGVSRGLLTASDITALEWSRIVEDACRDTGVSHLGTYVPGEDGAQLATMEVSA